MKTNNNDSQYRFWTLVRDVMDSDQYIAITAIVKEVQKRLDNHEYDNLNQAYSNLYEIASQAGVINPFNDERSFMDICSAGISLGKLDWEDAIAHEMEASRIPILSKALVDVYTERFECKPKTVLIAEAEKFVPNLHRIIDDNAESEFLLISKNVNYANALRHAFEGYKNVKIREDDIYQYEFTDERFDLIFACPIFGSRIHAEDQRFMCRELDMVALENLSLHLNNGGRLVITLPGRITFVAGKVGELRQFIQENYSIKEIDELPEGTIQYIGIKLYLLDIENSRPSDDDDVIIRRYSAGNKKTRRSEVKSLEVKDDTFVMLSELEGQGNWSVDRIFSQQDEEYLKFQNSAVRKESLGSVAQIFRGKSVTKKDQSGNIGVVNITSIGVYEIDYTKLDYIQEEERKVTSYLLQEGDLLLPARGTAIRTAVFHKQDFPCIASSNIIVIRPNQNQLDSTYLKIFLDSPVGNKMISGSQQGIAVMNISYKDLNVMEIPLPSLPDQQAKAKKYSEELQKYKETVSSAEKRWKGTLDELEKF